MSLPSILNIWFKIDELKLWAITDIPVEEISLSDLDNNLDICYREQEDTDDRNLSPRMFLENIEKEIYHAGEVNKADIQYPIELYFHQEQRIVLDGVHRFAKHHLHWLKTIKVRKISPEIAQSVKRPRWVLY